MVQAAAEDVPVEPTPVESAPVSAPAEVQATPAEPAPAPVPAAVEPVLAAVAIPAAIPVGTSAIEAAPAPAPAPAPAGPRLVTLATGSPAPAPAAAQVPYPGRPGAVPVPAIPGRPGVGGGGPMRPLRKAGVSNSGKMTLAFVLAAVVVVSAVLLIKRGARNTETRAYNELVEMAAKEDITELPINTAQLDILLNAASFVGATQQRQTVYKALFLAKPTDGADFDTIIARFATERPMQPDVREAVIRDVLRRRGNPVVVPILLNYARSTDDAKAAIAALQACRFMATEEHFGAFMEVVQFTPNSGTRQTAEEALAEILKKADNREQYATRLATAYEGAVMDDLRHSLIRLLARTGGDQAETVVRSALTSSEKKDQLAGVIALGFWADASMFETLMELLEDLDDNQLRPRAFDAGYRFLTDPDRTLDEDLSEDYWKMLARNAKSRPEQEKVIRGLAGGDGSDDWAIAILEYFVDEAKDDKVIDLAERALDRVRSRAAGGD